MTAHFSIGLVFAMALLASLLLMPLVVEVGGRLGLVTSLRSHGFETRNKSTYLGGLAVAVSVLSGLGFVSGISRPAGFILVGGLFLLVLGLSFDRRPLRRLRVGVRPVAQVAVVVFTLWYALRDAIDGPHEVLFCVLVLLGTSNAFRLLNNMSGVAAAISLGSSFGIVLVALGAGALGVATLGTSIAGASIGFLTKNVRRERAHLGEGGALFLGHVLSGSALLLMPHFPPEWRFAAVVCVLGAVAAGGWLVLFSRFLYRRRLFDVGLDQISYRLVRVGLSTKSVVAIHGVAALLASAAVAVIAELKARPEWMLAVIAVYAVVGLLMLRIPAHEEERSISRRRLAVVFGVLIITILFSALAPVIGDIGPSLTELRSVRIPRFGDR